MPGGARPRKYFPLSAEAIAAAARFLRAGRRSYARAGEPAHPSLRQVVAHLVGRGLVDENKPPPPATLGRALKRAGVALPAHWRSRAKRTFDVNISLCSSVDDGRTTPATRRPPPQPSLTHPWRIPFARPLGGMAGAPP